MDNHPLVSVVVIFLNTERFLQEAIVSVFAQSFSDWELLLVDDGSTDESTAIACRYVAKYPERIRYLEHPGHVNCGMSAARNLGIRESRGRYIAFLDADDVWYANTLEQQVGLIEEHPTAAMVYGPIEWWYSWKGKSENDERDYVEKLGVRPNTIIQPPKLVPLFLRDKAAVPSGLLVRREIIERVGGFEDAFRGEYEDQVFCAKVCLYAPVFASSQCWYRYRQHPDSCVMIGQSTGETFSARLIFLNWLTEYLTEQHIRDRSVWRALELEFWRFRHPLAFRLLRQSEQQITLLNEQLARFGQRR